MQLVKIVEPLMSVCLILFPSIRTNALALTGMPGSVNATTSNTPTLWPLRPPKSLCADFKVILYLSEMQARQSAQTFPTAFLKFQGPLASHICALHFGVDWDDEGGRESLVMGMGVGFGGRNEGDHRRSSYSQYGVVSKLCYRAI